MCDFHSTAWRLLGQDVQMCHTPNNSHVEMIESAGWRVNEPNRTTVVFEAEWGGVGEVPPAEKLIKNNREESPELVKKAVLKH